MILAQYPIFPWVLADYVSSTLPALLTNPAAFFRDRARPDRAAMTGDRLRE